LGSVTFDADPRVTLPQTVIVPEGEDGMTTIVSVGVIARVNQFPLMQNASSDGGGPYKPQAPSPMHEVTPQNGRLIVGIGLSSQQIKVFWPPGIQHHGLPLLLNLGKQLYDNKLFPMKLKP